MALFNRQDLRRIGDQVIQRENLGKSFQRSANEILYETAQLYKNRTRSFDIFLSHSSLDAKEILALKYILEQKNYSVYVDWIEDKQLDRTKVNKETAQTLKDRMNSSKCLFFATSENSPNSKWMPWELGYFDGKKEKVAILPITDTATQSESYQGQEYLGLYPYIVQTGTELYVHEGAKVYVGFDRWLQGVAPSLR